MNQKDIDKLMEINRSLNSKDTELEVAKAKIDNPSKAVEESLTTFVTSQFSKLENDNEFQNLIRLHIRQRLGEATFEQLIELDDRIAKNNTEATNAMLGLFKNDQSGKIITDHLKENDNVSSVAQQLYDSTENKDVLQAVSYLSQIMSKFQSQEAEIKENQEV